MKPYVMIKWQKTEHPRQAGEGGWLRATGLDRVSARGLLGEGRERQTGRQTEQKRARERRVADEHF